MDKLRQPQIVESLRMFIRGVANRPESVSNFKTGIRAIFESAHPALLDDLHGDFLRDLIKGDGRISDGETKLQEGAVYLWDEWILLKNQQIEHCR